MSAPLYSLILFPNCIFTTIWLSVPLNPGPRCPQQPIKDVKLLSKVFCGLCRKHRFHFLQPALQYIPLSPMVLDFIPFLILHKEGVRQQWHLPLALITDHTGLRLRLMAPSQHVAWQTVCSSQCHSPGDPGLCRGAGFLCPSLVLGQVGRIHSGWEDSESPSLHCISNRQANSLSQQGHVYGRLGHRQCLQGSFKEEQAGLQSLYSMLMWLPPFPFPSYLPSFLPSLASHTLVKILGRSVLGPTILSAYYIENNLF